jgi:hypothetical protein
LACDVCVADAFFGDPGLLALLVGAVFLLLLCFPLLINFQ